MARDQEEQVQEQSAEAQVVASEEEQTTEAQVEEQAVEPEIEGDEIAVLTAELEKAKAQAAEYLDGWQRSRAEFANFRRRQEQQQKQMDVAAKSRVLTHLLPVIDDLKRAFDAIPDEIEENSWVSGLLLVEQKWIAALDKAGLSVVPAQSGEAFDPTYHEAMTHEPSPDFDEGLIIQVIQQGYMLDDVVLRPALVRVSNGKIDQEN